MSIRPSVPSRRWGGFPHAAAWVRFPIALLASDWSMKSIIVGSCTHVVRVSQNPSSLVDVPMGWGRCRVVLLAHRALVIAYVTGGVLSRSHRRRRVCPGLRRPSVAVWWVVGLLLPHASAAAPAWLVVAWRHPSPGVCDGGARPWHGCGAAVSVVSVVPWGVRAHAGCLYRRRSLQVRLGGTGIFAAHLEI